MSRSARVLVVGALPPSLDLGALGQPVTIEPVADLEEALESLEVEPTGVVVGALTDGVMTTAIESLRAAAPTAPLLAVVTGDADSDDLLTAGATDVVTEDDSQAVFLARLTRLLETARPEAQLSGGTALKAQAMDEAPIGISIADMTEPDEPLVYFNDAFERMTGYDRSEAIGRNCRFLQGKGTDPEPVDALRAAIDARESVVVELTNYRADGTPFRNRVDLTPLTDPDGGTYYVGFQQDVTDRHDLDRERRAMIDVFRQVQDVTTDPDQPIDVKLDQLLAIGREKIGLSYAFLTEIDREEATQRIAQAVGDHELLQTDSECPLEQAYCRRTIESESVHAVQNAIEADSITEEAYETFGLGSYVGATVTVDGELHGTLCFADREPRAEPFSRFDLLFVRLIARWMSYELERERANDALQAKNDRLEAFANVVSHDLRNPLNVAQGHIDLLQEECTTPHAAEVADALDRMGELIDDLLTLAQHGESVDSLEPVSLAEWADCCWGHLDTHAATIVPEATHHLMVDRSRFSQLLENLFRNAIEHGREDVEIRVGDLPDGFYVEDDGPGIPAADREAVLESGFTTSKNGTGFGLAIVSEIADAHGWTVTVTEGTDGGARFEFTGIELAVCAHE